MRAARTSLARARLGLGQPARALEALADAESLAVPGQPLTSMHRRSMEIAIQAAVAAGDNGRADRLKALLASAKTP